MNNALPDKERLQPDAITPWHWRWAAALAAIVLIAAAFRYALPIRDGDIWFHLLYGKYFLENKTLIADHTIFSWTPSSNEYIYCTWLPDIFLYLLHKATGLTGLFAFRYFCIAILIGACFLYARRLKVATHPLTWFFCLLAVLMSYTAIFEKPEILSFVFMTLAAWNWWHIRAQGEVAWKNCYLFPLIMLVWVNSHGGFVFGAVFYVLIWLGEMLNTWLSPANALSPRLRRHLTIALTLAALSVLATPYGYHYPWQLVYEMLPTKANLDRNSPIASYTSPFSLDDRYSFVLCADIAVILLLLLFLRNFRKIEWSSLLANLVFAFLYTRFFRTTFYWVPIFLFSSLPLLASTSIIPASWKYAASLTRLLPPLTLASATLLSGSTLYNAAVRPEPHLWMGFGLCYSTPVSEAGYIRKYFPTVRIGNTYDQGAYLLWELWPRNKVFLDARFFPYRSWIDDYFSYAPGKTILAFTEKYPADLWCVSHSAPEFGLWFNSSPDWQLAFYGNNAAVFVRKDTPLPAGAPKISSDIAIINNQRNAIAVLTWAINIQDWQTADRILARMRQYFTLPAPREITRKASAFAEAAKAYHKRDYTRAASFFEAAYPNSLIKDDIMYAHTLIHLSVAAWRKGNGQEARVLNRKAWELVPGYYVNIYNAGAMNWHDWRRQGGVQGLPSSMDLQSSAPIAQGLWQMQFREFLKIAPRTRNTERAIEVAKALLAGSTEPSPELMLPPL